MSPNLTLNRHTTPVHHTPTPQVGLREKKETSRKQIKEAKNRSKKIRGTGRRITKHKTKRANKG